MTELETRLRALSDELAWPETPDLAVAVTTALADARATGRQASRRRGRRSRRVAATAAAALVLLPAAGAAAFPDARDDVLEWLGLRRTEVQRAVPPAARAPAAPDFGARTDLERATRRAGFRPLLPAELGAPDAVHVARLGAASRITLVYRPRPGFPALPGADAGLIVTQVRGRLEGDLVRKIAGPGTGVRRVDVDGDPGVVFTGAPHVYLYLDPAGEVVEDRPWLAGTTLVFERGPAVVRLEAETEPEALRRIAASMRVRRPAG